VEETVEEEAVEEEAAEEAASVYGHTSTL